MKTIRSEAGNAAVEFAILAPILTVLVAGLGDMASAVNLATKLNSAARAGATYAMVYPSDTNGVKVAAQAATNDSGMTVGTPSLYCTCGSSAVSVSNPTLNCTTGTCASGKVKKWYVSVATTQTYTPILSYHGFFSTLSMSGSATVEVQ